ncbi:MAG: branched-chain amino acid aminotransferase [Bdellovibrionales bacterium]
MNFPIQRTTQLKPLPPADDLQFGRHFTDHVFYCAYSDVKGWHNPHIAPYGPISMPPSAAVFHYGQAMFEGLKAYRQQDGKVKLFRPDFNCDRMRSGAPRLCLPQVPVEIFLGGIRELVRLDERWVPSVQGSALYIRPTLIATEGMIRARPATEALFFILLCPVGPYFKGRTGPVRIYVEDHDVRAVPGGLGSTKASANYVASFASAMRAVQKGFDQVLWLNADHSAVEEVGTMNIFFVFDDEIVTPALNGSILPGGMRDSVLRLLRKRGRSVSERRITIEEVVQKQKGGHLREVFGTGTAAAISPVGEFTFQGQTYKVESPTSETTAAYLLDEITGLQYGHKPDEFKWMRDLDSL